MAALSSHVLDTSRGLPAEGVLVELYSSAREILAWAITDADGRVSLPETQSGSYTLAFHAGEYFRRLNVPLTDPPFLDVIVIRFGISGVKCHVPLLVSPYGYSTYRGS